MFIHTYEWQVHLRGRKGDGCTRHVTARTEEGAKRTALYAERLTGNKTKGLRAHSAKLLREVGTPIFDPTAPRDLFPGPSTST